VAGGIAFDAGGRAHDDYVDRLGHGTAVIAVNREKAPAAQIYAVKVFDRSLRAEIAALQASLEWAVEQRVHIVNLSLGTAEEAHEAVLGGCVERATAAGVLIVSALRTPEGASFLPGRLEGVLPVELDWDCPRDAVRLAAGPGGRWVCRASGYPRPIPGVPPERNLKGLSFAVANATGLLAAAIGDGPVSLDVARDRLDALARPKGR
jgi:hypothetical protein